MKFSIKIGVPRESEKHTWGDYHFALGLKKYLERLGNKAVINILPDWYKEADDSDAVIVLRGLSKYTPQKKHINIIWNISHPEKISNEEYNSYDFVFIASKSHAERLQREIKTKVFCLLQCTDPEIFYPDKDTKFNSELLFVGNSRNVFRQIIKDLLPTNHPFKIWGLGWKKFIDNKYISGEYFPNEKLRVLYSSCKILLNDHWPDMVKMGFINNRIFDALACKTFIISDHSSELEDFFGDSLAIYSNKDDLDSKIDFYLNNQKRRDEIAETGYKKVINEHTFEKRAKTIMEVLENART